MAVASTSPRSNAVNARAPRETAIVLLSLATFVIICTIIGSRRLPWGDEAQFADPAANLYLHGKFNSTLWGNQDQTTFWAGNAPGYPMFLWAIFESVGLSLSALRVVHALLMSMAVLALWSAAQRQRWITGGGSRILMVWLLLTGFGCYYCYSNIRYDSLCLLLTALCVAASAVSRSTVRHALYMALGAAASLTNLQMPLFAGLLVLLIAMQSGTGWRLLWQARFVFVGLLVGGVSLLLLYASHDHAMEAFRATLREQAGQGLPEKLRNFSYYFQYDISTLPLIVALLATTARWRRSPRVRPIALAALVWSAALPATFFLSRRFVMSSAWMVYVPVAIATCIVWDEVGRTSRTPKLVMTACLIVSMAVGLPKAAFGALNEWELRDYHRVADFVRASLRPDDVVLAAPEAYFASKNTATQVFGPAYYTVMSATERASITVIIIDPANEEKAVQAIGGEWERVGHLLSDGRAKQGKLLPIRSNYHCELDVLRRTPAPTSRAKAEAGQK